MTPLEEMSLKIKQFCEERDWVQYHGPKDLAIGVSTEAAELLELFRFLDEKDCAELLSRSEGRTAVADELADVLFFLIRFAQLNDFDLIQALQEKMIKNARKYPVEKAKGNNQKYTEL